MTTIFSGRLHPAQAFPQITNFHIVGEEQLSKNILGRGMSLHRRLLKPTPGFYAVWNQQRAIPQELAHEILSVQITVLRQPPQFCNSLVPLLQRQSFVADHISQRPVTVRGICEFLWLIILLDAIILKADHAASNALRLTNNGVLD